MKEDKTDKWRFTLSYESVINRMGKKTLDYKFMGNTYSDGVFAPAYLIKQLEHMGYVTTDEDEIRMLDRNRGRF